MQNFQMQARFMNPQQVQSYLNDLRSGHPLAEGVNELEKVALGNYVQAANQVQQIDQAITQMKKDLEGLQDGLKRAEKDMDAISGEMSGYGKLLVAAEDARRAPPAPPAGETPSTPDARKAAAESRRKLRLEATGDVIPAAPPADAPAETQAEGAEDAPQGPVEVKEDVQVPTGGEGESEPQDAAPSN
jgi:hypothetical protein